MIMVATYFRLGKPYNFVKTRTQLLWNLASLRSLEVCLFFFLIVFFLNFFFSFFNRALPKSNLRWTKRPDDKCSRRMEAKVQISS